VSAAQRFPGGQAPHRNGAGQVEDSRLGIALVSKEKQERHLKFCLPIIMKVGRETSVAQSLL
jgi:hypothetical protein